MTRRRKRPLARSRHNTVFLYNLSYYCYCYCLPYTYIKIVRIAYVLSSIAPHSLAALQLNPHNTH
jgi:hypothetical protein